MPKLIRLPDGQWAEFPDTVSDAEVEKVLRGHFGGRAPVGDLQYDPTGTPTERVMAASGKFFVDTARGAKQLATEAVAATPTDPFGMRPTALAQREQEKAIRKQDRPLMATPEGKAGYLGTAIGTNMIASTLGGPVQMLTAPRTLGQAALAGPLAGALMPAESPMERGRNIAYSTGGALAGQAPGLVLQHVARPMQKSKAAEKLLSEGVVPTPGQAADPSKLSGRLLRNVEERTASIPVVGEPIHAARERAIGELNEAAIRRAGGVGRGQEAVAAAGTRLGSELDDLAATVGKVQASGTLPYAQLRAKLAQAGKKTLMESDHKNMLKEELSRFDDTLSQGTITGTALADLRSQWLANARSFSNSSDPSQRNLGKALNEAAGAVDDFVENSAQKEVAEEYAKVREQYAHLVRVEGAAAKAAGRPNEPGVFTPQQYMQAVKESAGGLKRKTVATGSAMDQDLATAGMALRNTRPDSGTPERVLNAGMLTAALTGGAVGSTALGLPWWVAPAAATAGTASVYGLRPVTKYAIGGYALQDPVANAIQQSLRPAGGIAGAYGLPLFQQ